MKPVVVYKLLPMCKLFKQMHLLYWVALGLVGSWGSNETNEGVLTKASCPEQYIKLQQVAILVS